MIAFGIGQGIGNCVQTEPAIACLRARGLKVYATKNCTWPNGWHVLDGRVDGYVDNGDPNVTHFIQGCWHRPFNFPNAKNYYVPYEPINQVDLHWKAANEFFKREYGKNLNTPLPPKLEVQADVENKQYIAIHMARTKGNNAWRLKLYSEKRWFELVSAFKKNQLLANVGIQEIDLGLGDSTHGFSHELEDKRLPVGSLPYEHMRFLKEECKALITSASGWAFMGSAIGIPTYVLWGPDSLKRNEPIGGNVHILKHDDCHECFDIKTLRTNIPECPYNNKCMGHTSKEIIDAIS